MEEVEEEEEVEGVEEDEEVEEEEKGSWKLSGVSEVIGSYRSK